MTDNNERVNLTTADSDYEHLLMFSNIDQIAKRDQEEFIRLMENLDEVLVIFPNDEEIKVDKL